MKFPLSLGGNVTSRQRGTFPTLEARGPALGPGTCCHTGNSCCRTVKKDRVALFKSGRCSVPGVGLGRGCLGCPEHTASEAKLRIQHSENTNVCRDRNVKPNHSVVGETPQGPEFQTLISSIAISSEKKGFSLKKLGKNNHRAQERLPKNTFCFAENPSLGFWLPHSLGILVSWNPRTGLSPECDGPASAEPRHDANLLQELGEAGTI